jgi:hypothetical protein
VNSEKYIGLDVHQATISVAVMEPRGKVVTESILETKASTILGTIAGLTIQSCEDGSGHLFRPPVTNRSRSRPFSR